MAFWLMKSEPEHWSWDDQCDADVIHWEGVRNYQAANNMKAMHIGDQAFFYHSGRTREIVGIVEIVKPYYPDPTDPSGRFGMVDVKTVAPLSSPVTLADIKQHPDLQDMPLVKQPRLSVGPVTSQEWNTIIAMSKADNNQ